MVFETDPQLLQEALDLTNVDSMSYAVDIEDTKFQLKLWFLKHQISLYRRSAAHELANMGRLYALDHYVEWESDVPAHVADCVMGDLPKYREVTKFCFTSKKSLLKRAY